MDLKQLGREIIEISYKEGEFVLSSGRSSTYIFDKYAFETRPKLLDAIAEGMANMLNSDVSRIAGMELGGVPLATALSLKTGLPFVIVRKGKKGYGIDRSIEGDLVAEDRVIIVEDIATTGAQALFAAEAVEEAGAKVSSILYVVDREEGAREGIESKGYRFDTLFTKSGLGVG